MRDSLQAILSGTIDRQKEAHKPLRDVCVLLLTRTVSWFTIYCDLGPSDLSCSYGSCVSCMKFAMGDQIGTSAYVVIGLD